MFCKYCGNEIQNNSLFCRVCGNKINNAEESKEVAVSVGKKTKNNMGISIISLVIAIFFTFLFCYGILAIPFSIIATICSNAVDKNILAGDIKNAEKNAKNAMIFSIISIIISVSIILIFLLLICGLLISFLPRMNF